MRAMAFIDIETTGLEADYHDIVEIAAVRLDASTWEVQTELNVKVHPEHHDRIDPEVVRINNYSVALWEDALHLRDALVKLTPMLNGCVIAGHNVHFDWSFLLAAYWRHEIVQPEVDYHLLDTASLAWPVRCLSNRSPSGFDVVLSYSTSCVKCFA